MKKDVLLFAAGCLIVCGIWLASHARVYRSDYLRQDSWIGIAWDAGGIELYNGKPAIFLCPANYDYEAGTRWDNPIAPFFPDLVADC